MQWQTGPDERTERADALSLPPANATSNTNGSSAMPEQINEALRSLYRENWDVFAKAMEEGTSAPLLLSASDAYREAEPRLFFVGHETDGWDHPDDTKDPIGELMERYQAFRFGKDTRQSPFWRVVHGIRKRVNPGSSDTSILWSNLSKVDDDGQPPTRESLGPLRKADILPREIEIARPDAAVFLAGGPGRYDRLFRRTFRGVDLTQAETEMHLYRLAHPALPELSFRTLHPKYLREEGQWDLVEGLSEVLSKELGKL